MRCDPPWKVSQSQAQNLRGRCGWLLRVQVVGLGNLTLMGSPTASPGGHAPEVDKEVSVAIPDSGIRYSSS